MAESKKELESVCETVETIGKRNSCTIDIHYLKQREALNTALPIGVRPVSYTHLDVYKRQVIDNAKP